MIKVPDGIVEAVLGGCGLKSVMIPDSSIPSNRPRHLECYRFPHVILKGERLWAMTRQAHVVERERSNNNFVLYGFGYSIGVNDIFYTLTDRGRKRGLPTWMPMSRYESFKWMRENRWKVAWNSEKPLETETLKKAVSESLSFKIHLLDDEDFWNIHPVDLVRIDDENRFEIRTEPVEHPMPLRDEMDRERLFPEIVRRFENGEIGLQGECMEHIAYYCVNSDGTYYNYYDIFRPNFKKYKKLIVFMEERDD